MECEWTRKYWLLNSECCIWTHLQSRRSSFLHKYKAKKTCWNKQPERVARRQKCRLQDDVLGYITAITVSFKRASQTWAERSEGRAPKKKPTACLTISHTDSFRRKWLFSPQSKRTLVYMTKKKYFFPIKTFRRSKLFSHLSVWLLMLLGFAKICH